MLRIKESDKRLSDIARIDQIAINGNTNVFMFGAGIYAHALVDYMKDNGLNSDISYVVDDRCMDSDKQNDGRTISFSEYIEKYSKKAPLVFGIFDYRVVTEKRRQYEDRISYMFDLHITVINDRIVDWTRDFVMRNRYLFEETYGMLSDDKSRNTMQCYLDASIGGEFDRLFNECREEGMYFEGPLKDYLIDKIFDCGAYDGDSIHEFIEAHPDYSQLYAFEPDGSNVEKIIKRKNAEGMHDLHVIGKGVWSETTILHFASGGTPMSSISETGGQTIEVIKLDDMYECFDRNSLIKMDIEGSELEALKGAKRVIKEISPALAICVYHKKEDLITIPQFIASLVPEDTYDYHLGYQGTDLAELVFYAVPKR